MAAPKIPSSFNFYNSYVTDPHYARIMEASFGGLALLCVLLASKRDLARKLRHHPESGFLLSEASTTSKAPQPTQQQGFKILRRRKTLLDSWLVLLEAVRLRLMTPIRIPFRKRKSYLRLSAGQILLLLCLPAIILSCLLPEQRLKSNPNRLGFFSLALFPPIFVLAAKAFVPLNFLLSGSYVTINFVHRWIGRSLFILALAHGSTWMAQWAKNGTLSQRVREDSKVQTGIAGISLLFLVALSSLKPIRKRYYQVFYAMHILLIVALLIVVNMHTMYALPWIGYGAVLIWGVDLTLRLLFKTRFVVCTVTPLADGMTRVLVHHTNSGYRAGQHVQLRLLSSPSRQYNDSKWLLERITGAFRGFESHPYTIAAAPINTSAHPGRSSSPIYIRSAGNGTWSGDVQQIGPVKRVWAVLEGPYGSSPAVSPVYDSQTLLLLCGGSGISWALAVADEAIGLTQRGEGKLKKCILVWVISSARHISWVNERLETLSEAAQDSKLDFDIQIHVTRAATSAEESVYSGADFYRLFLPASEHARPSLQAIFSQTIKDAVNPCQVCKHCNCAIDPENQGCCPNDAENCCQSPEQIQAVMQDMDEIESLSRQSAGGEGKGKASCCQSKKAKTMSCCDKGGGEGKVSAVREPKVVRDDGLTIGLCGPRSLNAEAKSLVSRISLAEQRRIGSIRFLEESFDI